MNWKVFVYAPNIIGYVRILFSLYSFYVFDREPETVLVLYFLSFILDAVDGHVARWLNQSTAYGAVLDMVTDRFSTAALATILSHFYPDYIFHFILLNILDFVSHWYRMYSTLYRGEKNHKLASKNEPFLLTLYYSY